jgi:hypothetical protein
MVVSSQPALRRRSRSAYEWARVKQSVVDAFPALGIALGMVVIARSLLNLALGAGLFLGCAGFRFLGKGWARGVGPGLALAGVPVLMPSLAMAFGQTCVPTHCHLLCSSACVLGGIVTGFALARLSARSANRPEVWAVSGAILAVSSLAGCGCIGVTSLVWFVASLGTSAIASGLVIRAAAERRTA